MQATDEKSVTGVTLEKIKEICEDLKKRLPVQSGGYVFTELEVKPEERRVLLKGPNGFSVYMSFELVYLMHELASCDPDAQKDTQK